LSSTFLLLQQELSARIVGQQHLVERLMITLLADGHLLVEGAPGLAKTRAVKTLAALVDGSFQRIQFTPDLLPGDVTGSEIYRADDGSFEFQPGPVFNNLVLADEVNRAPAKVQSALLEAMGERQVSAGRQTRELPELFMVMATQNPVEQQGTYPLPEAQLDRFLLHVKIDYPQADAENEILELSRAEALEPRHSSIQSVITQTQIHDARREVLGLHMNQAVQEYLVQLVLATRKAESYSQSLADSIEYGASPRATIAIDRCARARAWLQGRDFVTPDDVQATAADCLRHRIVVSLAAQARGLSADDVLDELFDHVPAG